MLKKIKEKGQVLKQEVNKKIVAYIMAGFGFVAGLAWNEAIKAFIEYFFPMDKSTLWAKFIYAVVLTLVLVVISIYLAKILEKREDNKS